MKNRSSKKPADVVYLCPTEHEQWNAAEDGYPHPDSQEHVDLQNALLEGVRLLHRRAEKLLQGRERSRDRDESTEAITLARCAHIEAGLLMRQWARMEREGLAADEAAEKIKEA